MPEIDPITGLPKELGTFENLAKESQFVEVSVIKKKFGKLYTVVSGLNEHEIDTKDIAKKLKAKFACGGTSKDSMIELQGDHSKSMRSELINLGFALDTIKVIPNAFNKKNRR